MATDLAKALPNAMGLVQQMQPAIEMALPKHVSADRMVRVCLTMLRNTPKLALCTRESLLGSIIELAQLGLDPRHRSAMRGSSRMATRRRFLSVTKGSLPLPTGPA